MRIALRKRHYIIASAVIILIVSYFIGESILSSKIEKAIKTELSSQLIIDYEVFDFSLFKRQVVLQQVKLLPKNEVGVNETFEIEFDKFLVRGFSLWKFLIKDQISIKEINFLHPQIVYTIQQDEKREESHATPIKVDKSVRVNRFRIENAEVHIYDKVNKDSLLFETAQLNFALDQLKIDENSLQNKIPFVYDDYSLSLGDSFYRLSDFENLRFTSFQSTTDATIIEHLSILTRYSKDELQKHLLVERDHFEIDIPRLSIKEQSFGFEEDSTFYFRSPEVNFQSVNMKIYRDKLTADDETHKKLYSKMLRELNMYLSLDQVFVENAAIAYSEKVNEGMDAGTVSFYKLNANIQNLGNTYAPKVNTQIDIDAIFMKQTPIEVQWAFDVHNLDDQFIFKAVLGKLPAMDMNPFSQPNLKIKLNGELLKTYFTIGGNHSTGNIDMKMSFSDFNVEVLSGDGQRKNKVLSAIADIFIKRDSDSSEDDFREISKNEVERDPTKSVFNFLWQNVKAALIGVMT
ncbi:MAG TPA: hypothetical protein VLZ83_01710 [Edaphocola sp.]|nr:hypothetical protein [Edaphocola sp.]